MTDQDLYTHITFSDLMASKRTPPKFSIANGFVIGSFPKEIKFFSNEGQRVTRKVEDDNSRTH